MHGKMSQGSYVHTYIYIKIPNNFGNTLFSKNRYSLHLM